MKIKQIKYLVPLLLVVIIACGGGQKATIADQTYLEETTDKLKKAVKETITDSDRQAKVMAIIDETISATNELSKDYKEYKNKSINISSNYEASEAEFLEVIESYNKKHEAFIQFVIKSRRTARNFITDQEWDSLYDLRIIKKD